MYMCLFYMLFSKELDVFGQSIKLLIELLMVTSTCYIADVR